MFENYDPAAQAVLYFARTEAGLSGSSHIEAEHLLIGTFCADRQLTERCVPGHPKIEEDLHRQLAARNAGNAPIPEDAEIPLSKEAKRILGLHVPAEAAAAGSKRIGAKHILLGILREEDSVAVKTLKAHGVDLDFIRVNSAMQDASSGPRPDDLRPR